MSISCNKTNDAEYGVLKWTFYDSVAKEEVGQTVHVNTI